MQITVTMMTSTNTIAKTENQKYEVDSRCMDCHFNAFDRLLTKYEAAYNQRQEFFGYFNLLMARGACLTMAQLYSDADLIISKGQGNFEGLIKENDPRIFHLLMVKCDVVAELLNVKKDSFVVYNKSVADNGKE